MKFDTKHILFGLPLVLAAVLVAAPVAENWENHCAKCHGADGKGQTKAGKKLNVRDYTDAKVQAEMKDDDDDQGDRGRCLRQGRQGKDEGLQRRIQPGGDQGTRRLHPQIQEVSQSTPRKVVRVVPNALWLARSHVAAWGQAVHPETALLRLKILSRHGRSDSVTRSADSLVEAALEFQQLDQRHRRGHGDGGAVLVRVPGVDGFHAG